jgi:hypothetical protein
MGRTFPHSLKGGAPSPGPPSYAAFASSPFANDLLVQAAKAAITAEGLGKDDVPDLLAVSFSATDLVYHQYGPYSWEMQDALVRLDRQIGDLLAAAEKAAGGRQNLLVVLSSDHGGAALPEEWIAAGINATRVKPSALKQGLAQELQTRFGAPVLLGMVDRDVYLNGKVLAEKKLDAAAVRRAAAEWLARSRRGAGRVERRPRVRPGAERIHARAPPEPLPGPERGRDVPPQAVRSVHGGRHRDDARRALRVRQPDSARGLREERPARLYRMQVHASDVAPTAAMLMEMGAPAVRGRRARVESVVQGAERSPQGRPEIWRRRSSSFWLPVVVGGSVDFRRRLVQPPGRNRRRRCACWRTGATRGATQTRNRIETPPPSRTEHGQRLSPPRAGSGSATRRRAPGQRSTISSDRSIARAEWVSAPIDT